MASSRKTPSDFARKLVDAALKINTQWDYSEAICFEEDDKHLGKNVVAVILPFYDHEALGVIAEFCRDKLHGALVDGHRKTHATKFTDHIKLQFNPEKVCALYDLLEAHQPVADQKAKATIALK